MPEVCRTAWRHAPSLHFLSSFWNMQKMTKQWKIALLPCKSFVIRGYTGRKTNRTITYKMVRWVFRPPTPHETTKDKTHLSTTTRSLPRRPVGSPSSGVKLKNSQLSGHIVGAAHLAFRFTLQMYHHFHQWLWLKAYRLEWPNSRSLYKKIPQALY